MIEIRNLSRTFKDGFREFKVFDDIKLPSNEVLVIYTVGILNLSI